MVITEMDCILAMRRRQVIIAALTTAWHHGTARSSRALSWRNRKTLADPVASA
jgi:hypothetical protein